MQTTMSLQEEPRGKTGVFAEGPRAQTGLRGGKLATHYARIARSLPEECLKPLISSAKMVINSKNEAALDQDPASARHYGPACGRPASDLARPDSRASESDPGSPLSHPVADHDLQTFH
jgi:hypothetical protein